MLGLPSTLTKSEIQLICTRWPFFNIAHSYAVPNLQYGFPSCNVIKTAVQALYNSMKGGLDANSQQSLAILPPIKTGFEQKYVIRLIIAIVTNSWRALQLLGQPIDHETSFSMYMYRKQLVNNCLSLKDFSYNLPMALITSSTDPYFQNVLVAHTNRTQNSGRGHQTMPTVDALGVERNPDTLAERLQGVSWPRRHRFRQFTKNKILLELRLTENDTFSHVMEKGNTKKHTVHYA
jgi:hypothetical protein